MSALPRRFWLRLLPLVLALLLGGWFVVRLAGHRPVWLRPLVTLDSFQDADAPLKMPAAGAPDHRFDRFSAWRQVEAPRALRFTAPLGSESGVFTRMAERGHAGVAADAGGAGDEWLGLGGGDTALGDPVFAVADGLVVFAGRPANDWGRTLVLAHRLADDRLVQSLYGRLGRIDVPLGALVARGTRIGNVGHGDGRAPARLRFAMRECDDLEIDAPPDGGDGGWLPAVATLTEFGMNPGPDLDPAPLAALLRQPDEFDPGRFEFSGDPARVAEILGAAGDGTEETAPPTHE